MALVFVVAGLLFAIFMAARGFLGGVRSMKVPAQHEHATFDSVPAPYPAIGGTDSGPAYVDKA
jgi:hypothetical protein